MVVTLVGAALIALISMFLAHGFNQRTLLAIIDVGDPRFGQALAAWFVSGAKLLGMVRKRPFTFRTDILATSIYRVCCWAALLLGRWEF